MTAGPDDSDLLPLAASIADGATISWAEIEQRIADRDALDLLDEFRTLDRIARAHRDAASGDVANARPSLDTGTETEHPQSWGHFVGLEPIGGGTFGTVYRATDSKLRRDVALKLLRTPASSQPAASDHLLNEARVLARIRHPNVVSVHGADAVEGLVGIWMEFVAGHTLSDVLARQGPFSAREAAAIGVDVSRALAAVHQAGFVHGDVKARNVMREEGGRTVLMDFGAGRTVGRADEGHADRAAGTPVYLAPEVFGGARQSPSSDIYSLGVLLFHLVTGTYPTVGDTWEAVASAHREGRCQRLADLRPDLPDEFRRVVERALAPDPGSRFHTPGGFEVALSTFLGAPAQAPGRLPRLAAAGAGVMLLLGLSYWLSTQAPSSVSSEPASVAPPTTTTRVAPAEAYTIEAALLRLHEGGVTRLPAGAAVAPGDRLQLEMEASVGLHVYVVNEDDRGAVFLLYPLPGQVPANPIPGGRRVQIPGDRAGARLSWQVTTAGGREHFIIFASPQPLSSFEQLFASLPVPTMGTPVVGAPLPSRAVGQLRGIGGLVAAPAAPAREQRLSDEFTTPLAATRETVRGIWIRSITLANPG